MLWKYVGLLLPIAAALRLAKFNNDPRQGKHFYGIPTPMAALFVAGIASMIFVFSVDPNDEKNLKQVSSIETLKKNDRIFMSVGKTEMSSDLFWKAEIKELADSGILLVQGPKKYRLPVVEMNQKISTGEVFVKATGFFNGYFFTLTGLILTALLLSILMLAEVSILAIKQLPERIWKISFFAGWAVVLFGGAMLHWSQVPGFSHPDGTGWLIRLSLNTPVTALLSALPFALVFHLLFSLIYFSLKPQQHEI
jgi:phosphatidylserine synthase